MMKRTDMLSCLALFFLTALPVFAQQRILIREPFFHPGQYHNLQWRSVGPFRGGRSVAVTGVPGQPLVYYLGATGGGVWKTTDAGVSWQNISDGFFGSGSIGAIAVAPGDPHILYAGTGEHAVRGVMTTHGDGVYQSVDGGRTWQHRGLPESRHIADIVIHPQDPSLVYVAVQGALYGPSAERGVFKSADGGETWRRVLFVNEQTGASDLVIDPFDARTLYAGMWDHGRTPWHIRSGGPGSGLYRSVDAGESWKKLTAGLPDSLGKVAVTASPARPGLLYANVEAAAGKGGVYRSDDGGNTWRQVSNSRQTVARAWYYIKIEADPRNPETVYVLNAPLLRSTDGGRSFQPVPNPHTDQHDLWINPDDPDNFILANDGGACITFNGGWSWSGQDNQPTGQFYRVITDERFPYFIYSAQQDYGAVAVPSRTRGAGIGSRDWQELIGCESAFLAFDPQHPDPIFGSCFQGNLYRYDPSSGERLDITAYPALSLGEAPRNMPYRFHWSPPLLAAPHDPGILYHAGNVVFRSIDGGRQWEVISPDLTRDDPARQGPGGGPYTNEGAGAEVYHTISYLAGSPHQPGLLWAGTDDGRVHLTLDDGQEWRDVTPPGMEEACVHSIEVSPHQPGTAYLAVHRYQFGDLRPYIYVTGDYGRSWRELSAGIDSEHFVRVVREDPVRPGLLYAGTEGGLYLSFDYGKEWLRFQRNLPVCPVTDLTIRHNDLVAATMGRGLYILDDLSALQQGGNQLGAARRLFRPRPATRYGEDATAPAPLSGLGQNPPAGMAIDYYLPESMENSPLFLQVLDAQGQVVRSFSNQAPPENEAFGEGGPPSPPVLPSRAGVNRFYWDLRREPTPAVPGLFLPGDYRGSRVAPGDYRLRLCAGGDTLYAPARVMVAPGVNAVAGDYRSQQQILQAVDQALVEIHRAVSRLREVDRRLGTLLESLHEREGAEALLMQGEALAGRIAGWQEQVVQTRQETQQDVINFPGRLNAQLMDLRRRMDVDLPVVTAGALRRWADLRGAWEELKREMDCIVEEEVGAFNRRYHQEEWPVLIVPE